MALLFRWAQACNPQNNIAPSPRARGYRQNHGSRAMGRGQPPGKLRNTQNKDTGQQPIRTPLVDRCGRTENSIENSRLDRLGNLDYALAPQDHPSRSATSPGTTLPARCHGDPLSQLPSRYFHRPTEMDAKLRASRERPHGSAGGEGIRRHRMRFSVRVPAQNALFRRVRFSSPGQTWRRLTEKRSLA